MKTSRDPRHRARVKIMQELFAWDFSPEGPQVSEPTLKIIENLNKIDEIIQQAAPAWPITKINKIDLAILRLAASELVIDPQNPTKVIVDEAVELAKEYGAESSASFINGALGKMISDQKISS